MSENCGVFKITVRQRHEDICGVIAEGLARAQSLPEFSANDNFAVGGSTGTSSDDGCSGRVGRSSS